VSEHHATIDVKGSVLIAHTRKNTLLIVEMQDALDAGRPLIGVVMPSDICIRLPLRADAEKDQTFLRISS
jgi:hypothetical protein